MQKQKHLSILPNWKFVTQLQHLSLEFTSIFNTLETLFSTTMATQSKKLQAIF